MPNYPAIRLFLANHQGYYCMDCVAARLKLSASDIRLSAGQGRYTEVAVAYRICQSCLDEKASLALRRSA